MKKKKFYLAIDLGGSGGRASIASINNGKIEHKIIHRFKDYQQLLNGHRHWDIIKIFAEIKKSIKLADNICGENLVSIGIDSWGVDYCYIDKSGALISNPYSYRDNRTNEIYDKIFEIISKEEIYSMTGVQFMKFNTIGQIYSDKLIRPWIFDIAEYFLMIPDLLNYFLTGCINLEKTNLSTTQLYDPEIMDLAKPILKRLEIPKSIFPEIIEPGIKIAKLNKEITEELGLDNNEIEVVSVASHDTASAIAAIPIRDQNSVYIINGTWSLLGLELNKPMINQKAMSKNFTNEVGVEGSIRFLKNITGLWLLEKCKDHWEKEQQEELSYEELDNKASKAEPDLFIIDPDDKSFNKPNNIPKKIKNYCKKTGQKVPENKGQIIRCIYESLANSYAKKINDLEELVDKKINKIHMAGGGARSKVFCKIVEEKCQRKVKIGPIEATVYGNILAQLKSSGEINSIREARIKLI